MIGMNSVWSTGNPGGNSQRWLSISLKRRSGFSKIGIQLNTKQIHIVEIVKIGSIIVNDYAQRYLTN